MFVINNNLTSANKLFLSCKDKPDHRYWSALVTCLCWRYVIREMLMANVAEATASLQATALQIAAVLAALVLLLFVIWRFVLGQEESELDGSTRGEYK